MTVPLPHSYVVTHDGTLDAAAVQRNLQHLAVAITNVVEPWHAVGATGQPAFQNGWVNLGGTDPPARFCKSPLGIVYVEAGVKTGTVDTTIFTLPVGYRPAFDLHPGAGRNGATGALFGLLIRATGDVLTQNSGANTNMAFIVSFRADQ